MNQPQVLYEIPPPGERHKHCPTAYHEASHTVVALDQSLSFDFVSILPDESSLGRIAHPSVLMYEQTSKSQRRATARSCILVCYAGYHAEKEAQKLYGFEVDKGQSQSDDDHAFELSRTYGVFPRGGIGHVGSEFHLAYLETLRQESLRIVRKNFPAIKKIAIDLAVRLYLDYVQVMRIIKE